MLFSNLERQGLDLSIEGNLVYFDVNRLRVGINTSTPEADLEVYGNAQVTGTLTIKNQFTGNSYSLPTDPGKTGYTLTTDGAGGTNWSSTSTTINRKQFEYYIPNLPSGDFDEFVIDTGIASIVYALTVNRPVLVEVFSNKFLNETNPYAFLATPDHLIDDGSVLLDDGSVIQQRQYSIFANQETPPEPRVYGRITNIDGVAGNVTLKLTYFAAVTDNSAVVYDANVVTSLPPSGYTGQTVVLKTDGKLYVWYDNVWNPTT
jgi:hypothetical protein